MGYEHLCLNTLLESYPENDIITDPSQFPQIKYQKCNNGVIKNCIYYPDIMVGDKLIEVKCEYTYKKEKELNKLKFISCLANGYNIDVWIYSDNGKQLIKKLMYGIDSFGNSRILKFILQ